jgi:hypothetical protein
MRPPAKPRKRGDKGCPAAIGGFSGLGSKQQRDRRNHQGGILCQTGYCVQLTVLTDHGLLSLQGSAYSPNPVRFPHLLQAQKAWDSWDAWRAQPITDLTGRRAASGGLATRTMVPHHGPHPARDPNRSVRAIRQGRSTWSRTASLSSTDHGARFCRCSAQPICTEPHGPVSSCTTNSPGPLLIRANATQVNHAGRNRTTGTRLKTGSPKGEGCAAEQHLAVTPFHARTATRTPGDIECMRGRSGLRRPRPGWWRRPGGGWSTGRRH